MVVVKPDDEGLVLDHLYIDPRYQGRGVGAAVLAQVFAEVDQKRMQLRVTALRGSDSNRFYIRYGFALVREGEWDNYYICVPPWDSRRTQGGPKRNPEAAEPTRLGPGLRWRFIRATPDAHSFSTTFIPASLKAVIIASISSDAVVADGSKSLS